jgi:zinc protease
MTPRLFWLLVLATATSACLGLRGPPRFGELRVVNRPFEFHHDIRVFTAKNGILLALLPDRRTNLVTVDARYLVGASDDPSGRSGLAHLVEHLTFEARTGTDRASLGDRMGEAALQYNAFTSHDVTHYTATALAQRLPDVLELEAQRLEMTCAQLDEDVFSRERDVVLEETAQRHTSWSEIQFEILRAAWGKHHPYARGVGTPEVAGATKEDACQFLGSHYTPERLMLVVTGDFDPNQVAQAIGKRFARIQRTSEAPRATLQQATLKGTRSRHQADVAEAMAIVFFPAPAWGSQDAALHEYALKQLHRLMARADREHDWITGVGVTTQGTGQARLLAVIVSVDEPKRLNAAVDEIFARAPTMFANVGPYEAASLLSQLRNDYVASYESFATRGPWLADYLTYTEHSGFMVPELDALAQLSLVDADRYARETFVRNKSHVALIEPSGRPATATPAAVASGRELDLAPWHAPADPLEAQRPLPAPATRVSHTTEEMTLDNGLRVLLAPDPTSVLVDVRLVFPHGSASDPPQRRGLATAAATLLESNPHRRFRMGDVLLLDWGLSVGTQLDREVYETSTVFSARGSSNRADWHVWRMLWLIEQCGYLDDSVEAFRVDRVRDSTEEIDPAEALTQRLLFGAGHPYATPPPTAAEWSWLTPSELERYRQTHYVPRGATLIVTGGFELEAMRKHVRVLFEPWADSAADPLAPIPAAQPATGPSWVGTRDASRTQVGLEVAFATASDPDRDKAARLVLREMVKDRLRIVREGMGASYGVQVSYSLGAGGGALQVQSELDPERAAKAATAIVSELEVLRAKAGELAEDFVRARRRVLATVLADAAGVTAVADELEYVARRGLPVDHIDQLALAISKVTLADIATVAAADFDPRRRVVSVTATPERVEALMRVLGATEPRIFTKKHRPPGQERAESVQFRASAGR